jgi:predicted GNAT family N-acyltransferase
MVDIVLVINNAKSKSHIQELLSSVTGAVETATCTKLAPVLDLSGSLGELMRTLEQRFFENPQRMLVLISDLLIERLPSSGKLIATECQEKIGSYAFGTIAILARPRRLADIDRAICPDGTSQDLERTLTVVIQRVRYIAAPSPAFKIEPRSISVRPLRAGNETEYREYFALRHRVYSVMGYLDEEIECCRSKLEMNEADLHAIHLGAFHRDGPQEKLVGTARVVTTGEADPALQAMFEKIARQDPLLKRRLNDPYPLGLPIFQSHDGMNQIMTEVFRLNQQCGEVSRVIVDQRFRGNDISGRLLAEVLRRSKDRGFHRLFLECLKTHEQLYEKYGFRRIPGAEGSVIDVYRTMISMELSLANAETVRKRSRYRAV